MRKFLIFYFSGKVHFLYSEKDFYKLLKVKTENNPEDFFFLVLLDKEGNGILKFINFLHREDFAKMQEGRKTV